MVDDICHVFLVADLVGQPPVPHEDFRAGDVAIHFDGPDIHAGSCDVLLLMVEAFQLDGEFVFFLVDVFQLLVDDLAGVVCLLVEALEIQDDAADIAL